MLRSIIFFISVVLVLVVVVAGCVLPLAEEALDDPQAAYSTTSANAPTAGTESIDQSFQIAVLPDTQRYTSSPTFQELFAQQTEWIVDNLVSEDIRFVTHLGDIVDKKRTTVPWEEQWPVADAAISLLDGHAPYSVAYGNHDFDVFNDSGAGSEMAQSWFGDSRYQDYAWYGGASPDGENFYQNFSAAGYGFLHLNLKYDPDEAAFVWAKEVLATNPERVVILSTHAYLTDEGPGGHRAPEGENIWNQLVKSHDQIFMVLGGHYTEDFSHQADIKNGVWGEYYQVSMNDAGREVYEMLADYQDYPNGGDGWMRLIEFDLENQSINVRTYSPARDDFQTDDGSQFSFTVDLASRLRQ